MPYTDSMKKYSIQQKITPLVNRYAVYDISTPDSEPVMIAFVEQKRFSFKEQIAFYTDETKATVAFNVKAEKVMDVHGRFNVTDASDNKISSMRKVFKSSLLRSTWEIMDSDDVVRMTVREKSLGNALFRRVWALLPYIGDIPFIWKYHFIFTPTGSETSTAHYVKTKRFRDHYELQVDDESLLETLGWQTLVAQGVLLDALQSR